jgi:hypothetical protein
MSTPTIIGLTGLARSGKTTVAEYLRDKHGFTVLNFADPLKEMVFKLDPIVGVAEEAEIPARKYDQVAYPVHLSDLTNPETGRFDEDYPEGYVKTNYPEYRRVLQTLGTECIRGVDPGFWVDLMRSRIMDLDQEEGVTRFVIADVRLQNEARLIQELGQPEYGYSSHLVHVKRAGQLAQLGGHVTEQMAGQLGETQVIHNYGGLADLGDLVDNLVEQLL